MYKWKNYKVKDALLSWNVCNGQESHTFLFRNQMNRGDYLKVNNLDTSVCIENKITITRSINLIVYENDSQQQFTAYYKQS